VWAEVFRQKRELSGAQLEANVAWMIFMRRFSGFAT
jgi:hypothetical protein